MRKRFKKAACLKKFYQNLATMSPCYVLCDWMSKSVYTAIYNTHSVGVLSDFIFDVD